MYVFMPFSYPLRRFKNQYTSSHSNAVNAVCGLIHTASVFFSPRVCVRLAYAKLPADGPAAHAVNK
jgi:hypothetical protein